MELIEEDIFKFAYVLAFRDATMRKAYQNDSDDKKACKENAKTVVNDALKVFLSDKVFMPMEYIDGILDKTKDNGFSFGNAQKLLNMFFKYLYIGGSFDPKMKKKFDACDCPIDGVMIKIIRENPRVSTEFKKVFPSDFPWSKKLTPEKYNVFQEEVDRLKDEGTSRLKFDFDNWDPES